MPLSWPDLELPPINLWSAPRMNKEIVYCSNFNCPRSDSCARSLDYEFNDSDEFNFITFDYYYHSSNNIFLCEGFLQVFDGK